MYICRIRWTKTDKERRLFPNIPRTYSTRYPGKLIATGASYPVVWILNGFWAVVQLPRPLWPVKYTRGYETVYLSSKISDAIMHGSRGVTLRFLRHRQTQRDANEMRPTDQTTLANRECITLLAYCYQLTTPRVTSAGPPIKMHRNALVKLLTVQ